MRAEGPHLTGYDPNFGAAVNEQASYNAGCRDLPRTRELRSSRRWTTGLLLLLPLTAVISIQFMSVAKAAIGGGPPLSAESVGALELSSCKLSGVPQPARCGVLEVAENPNRTAGRQLEIGVAVIPATGGKSRPDPIVILMGGPGEDAISAAEIYVKQFTALRQDRDILLVDQRGTGRSGALNCALFSVQEAAVSLRDLFPPAAVEKCEQNLRLRADLTQYTYDRFANDLEQVRQALGYGPLNLFGGSYGTRAAQVYLRMYPKGVRTVYMGSVVPLDAATPLSFAKTGQTALEKMFDGCAGDFACSAAFPNLRGEFRQVSARLSSGSVRVTVQGQTGTVPLDRGRVAEWFRSKLYRPRSSTALPWMIHRAFLGDWSPISEGVLADASDDSPFSVSSLRLRAARMSGISEKPTSQLKSRALS
jgi:pimeloyl-ACP methyl ester carboxylesterase